VSKSCRAPHTTFIRTSIFPRVAREYAQTRCASPTSALALLFIGIHNAWDSILYIVISQEHHETPKSE
jgi:hypothetical protein